MHYGRWQHHGDPLKLMERAKERPCLFPGCLTPQIAKRMCNRHYARQHRHGHLVPALKYDGFAKIRDSIRVNKWIAENRERFMAGIKARKTRAKQATPPWADRSAIQQIYLHCPKGSHVDHVIPLRGKLVSGLHIPSNLQYLTKAENLSKGRKVDLSIPPLPRGHVIQWQTRMVA